MDIRWFRVIKEGKAPIINDFKVSRIEPWLIYQDESYGTSILSLLEFSIINSVIPVMIEHDVAVDAQIMDRFEERITKDLTAEQPVLTGTYLLAHGANPMSSNRVRRENGDLSWWYEGFVDFIGWGFWAVRPINKILELPWSGWDYPISDTQFSLECQRRDIPLYATGIWAMHLHTIDKRTGGDKDGTSAQNSLTD